MPVGKVHPLLVLTGACSVSASSIISFMPSGVRAARSDMISGRSAATSLCAVSATAPESPCGGAVRLSLGMRRPGCGVRMRLQLCSHGDEHGSHGRRHGDVVSAHGGFGEVPERIRLIVPLHEIAHHRADVLRAVQRLNAAAALGSIGVVAHHHVDRHAVGIRVVNRHRRVLHADVPWISAIIGLPSILA